MEGESQRIIKNFSELVANGPTKIRRDALEIIESGIRSAIPYEETKKLVKLDNYSLLIGEQKINLQEVNNIYVVGVGKGSYPIALALDEILRDKIKEGIVVVKEGEKRRLKYIEVFESSHPLPDERSLVAARKIKAILDKADKNDIVLAAITGGSSALVNLLPPSIDIEELKQLNDLLLKSGASIGKMNAVRKHLCLMKGGRLVTYAHPAPVYTFTLDTAPPDLPWPDLVLPDPSTFKDAIDVLKSYDLWSEVSESIRDYLQKGLHNSAMETPKSLDSYQSYIFSVADPRSTCLAAARKAEELGYNAHILCTAMEGEASQLGIFLAGLVNEISARNQPFSYPCALISAGETTVTITGKCGSGGPNQETALGFVQKLYSKRNAVCVSIDTDGTDGPSQIAGGITDTQTKERAAALNLNLAQYLKEHDSSTALLKLGDAIITGHTGTNVMNLRVVLIE
ncbi:MAG TPA: DUF4147 domain-containing protein [Peptococcaceae bacterium]|nr:DUF4147 domain-containing protein [Peptococcaceae bacterium]